MPLTPEALEALPEYKAPDPQSAYSQSLMKKMFKDANGIAWWLIQYPDGTYCKAEVDD